MDRFVSLAAARERDTLLREYKKGLAGALQRVVEISECVMRGSVWIGSGRG